MEGYYFLFVGILLPIFVPSSAQNYFRSINYETEEEIAGQRTLGNIYTNGNLSDLFNNDEDVSYSIIADDNSQYFSVNDNGEFFVNGRIDREVDCARQVTCIYPVKVWAIQGTSIVEINVNVEITDVNDNSPQFTRSSESLSIPELTPPGATYELPIAIDLDSPANGVVQYTMASFDINTDDNFSLQVTNKTDGSQVLNLILNLTLDRETRPSYVLFVRALDYGNKSDQLTVNISVLDVNDNPPKFSQDEYNISMDEDIEVGTTIVTVTATDRDTGDNARLSYTITSFNPTTISQSIAINQTSGVIYMKNKIDSTRDAYTLYVEAKDHGNPPKTSDLAKVTINVKDKNDNPPVIQITLVKNGMVAEHSDIGTPVAHIFVDDADKGINKESECSCDNVNFTINKLDQMNFFKIDVNRDFDRETRVEYNVTVNCTDKGSPPLSSSKSFKVTITDINDNEPEFDTSYYEKSINENNQPGAVLFRLYASDKDEGPNADLTFQLEPFPPEDSKFYIEPKTGIIKAVKSFDRETDNATYTFRVIVKDNGDPVLNDTAMVRLIIMDVNDNAPKFVGDSYSMSVFENTNASESIGQIVARDPDEGDNGKVSFMIPRNYSSYPFNILDDGTMITTKVLDHEDKSQYSLIVTAFDHGNPPMQSNIQVSVIVKDKNDNAPIIDFPGDENYTVDVPNSAAVNQTLTRILAHDADATNNKRLSYSIISGNDEDMFWINERSGDIYLKKKVGDVMHYILTISAMDNGDSNQYETSATLHIKFFIANDGGASSETASAGSKNVLIAVIISCVTFVLSVALICVIGMICRKDRQRRRLYSHKQNDQLKIMDSNHRNSNRSSSSKGSQDKMLYPDHGYSDGFYQPKKKGKEVSFSFDDEQDTGISMSTSGGQFDRVSTFKSPSPEPSIQSDNMYKQQSPRVETPPPKPERSEDKKQREIYRMTSLKVHQALIKNNNNNNKPWPQPANDETTSKPYIGLTTRNHLDDCHSETSGETTTSDSGRGGSEEDIRSNMTGSHEADESRSPNTSTSHPFYTAESHQPTFSSFRGNSVHRNGPILSSFLNKGHNYKNSHENNYQNSFPLNDLSSPSVKSANEKHKHSDINLPNLGESATFTPGFGLGLGKLTNDPLLHGSHPSNLDIHNSLENGSITARSQDDDNTTTTSGSYTINDLQDELMNIQGDQMFYKPDTFV